MDTYAFLHDLCQADLSHSVYVTAVIPNKTVSAVTTITACYHYCQYCMSLLTVSTVTAFTTVNAVTTVTSYYYHCCH